jgi:hypothetical protein
MNYGLQRELLRRIQASGVPFVVVGGHAVVHHGHIRSTEDVDIVWLRSPEAESALSQALDDLRAAWISDEIDPKTRMERLMPVSLAYIRANHLMMLQTQYGFLDVFDYVPGAPEADVARFYEESVVAQDQVRYPSLEWLRRMKEAAGRAKDRVDLEELKRIHEERS